MKNGMGRFLLATLLALLAPRTGSAAPIEESYFLHGGAGAAQSGTAPLFAPWEESFTMCSGIDR